MIIHELHFAIGANHRSTTALQALFQQIKQSARWQCAWNGESLLRAPSSTDILWFVRDHKINAREKLLWSYRHRHNRLGWPRPEIMDVSYRQSHSNWTKKTAGTKHDYEKDFKHCELRHKQLFSRHGVHWASNHIHLTTDTLTTPE